MAKSDSFDNLNQQIGKNASNYRPDPNSYKITHNYDTHGFPGSRSSNRRSTWRNTAARMTAKERARLTSPKPADIIYIKERYFTMLKNDLILCNPLRVMGSENEDILNAGEIGAVLARAGVGKTAFLVQLSLNALLRNKNVLHISLIDPVDKVSLWYKEVFHLIAQQYEVDQMSQLWDSLLPHRFIMTFRVEGFSVPKLEERLSDLMEQEIFKPQMIIVDGFPFDGTVQQPLMEFKNLISSHGMPAWFTVRTHRHEDPDPDGIPMQLAQNYDLFKIAIQLLPMGKEVHVKALKGAEAFPEQLDLRLDPSTMLIKPKQ